VAVPRRWEFRHASWFADEVYDLLRRHGAALVIADHPERDPQRDRTSAPPGRIRAWPGAR